MIKCGVSNRIAKLEADEPQIQGNLVVIHPAAG